MARRSLYWKKTCCRKIPFGKHTQRCKDYFQTYHKNYYSKNLEKDPDYNKKLYAKRKDDGKVILKGLKKGRKKKIVGS